jgi:hypothetical protein
MMILAVTLMVIPAQAGMMLVNLQDHMVALVDMMMMILMLLNSAVHVREQNHPVVMML